MIYFIKVADHIGLESDRRRECNVPGVVIYMMAARVGFEPTLGGLTVPCLTDLATAQ